MTERHEYSDLPPSDQAVAAIKRILDQTPVDPEDSLRYPEVADLVDFLVAIADIGSEEQEIRE